MRCHVSVLDKEVSAGIDRGTVDREIQGIPFRDHDMLRHDAVPVILEGLRDRDIHVDEHVTGVADRIGAVRDRETAVTDQVHQRRFLSPDEIKVHRDAARIVIRIEVRIHDPVFPDESHRVLFLIRVIEHQADAYVRAAENVAHRMTVVEVQIRDRDIRPVRVIGDRSAAQRISVSDIHGRQVQGLARFDRILSDIEDRFRDAAVVDIQPSRLGSRLAAVGSGNHTVIIQFGVQPLGGRNDERIRVCGRTVQNEFVSDLIDLDPLIGRDQLRMIHLDGEGCTLRIRNDDIFGLGDDHRRSGVSSRLCALIRLIPAGTAAGQYQKNYE